MTIVANNSITVSNVNDGTITHTAYANSADGTNGFYVGGGGTNLLRNSDKLPYSGNNDNSWSTGKWRIAGMTSDTSDMVRTSKEITDPPQGGKATVISYTGILRPSIKDISLVAINAIPISGNVTVSFWARQTSSVDTAFVSAYWSDTSGMVNTNASTERWLSTPYRKLFLPKDGSWTRFWATFNVNNNNNVFIGAGNTGASAEVQICLVKIETGTTATPWSPAPSEAHPSYIGQYSDFTSTASTDPAKYAPWIIFKGNDGVGVTSTDITYAMSTSGTTAPDSGWTSSVPSPVKGQYLWTKTVWTYTDNSSKTGYSVTYISKDGIDGDDGLPGKDGVGIQTTTITYTSSTSGTTAPSTGWTSAVPTVPAGSYLWTKTVWGYTDNTSETGYSVAMMGVKGQPGANAPTITNVQDQIYLSTSNTAQSGGSWGILIPAWSSGKYYWSRVATTFSNGTTTYSTPVLDEALNQATTNQVKVTQLTQDLDGFKTTVSNTYLSKSDASGTYADKVSVTSQINQSATAVTSNVQTWTNNKLTSYSTTQQTTDSITSAVANKADKSQITQLSDNINLKVSKGDVISSINQEAGQIVFNANKLVLNANTTEITGDAFIGGDMIVDGSIKAEKLEVANLSALSSSLGNITGGSYTSWKYIDMYNANGDTAMAGIYINEGVMRSLLVINSNTQDPDAPNALTLARLEGSQTAFGSTNYYIDDAPSYTQSTLNEVLKGSRFWGTIQQSDRNSIAGSIVGGKAPDSTSSIFISAQNAYISRWGTDSSVVDVNMLETISSHKVIFNGGYNNRYDATNNNATKALSLGNLVGVKYLQIYVHIYERLHIINLDISNTFSSFAAGIWPYSTLYNAPERVVLSPGKWRDWNIELLCKGAIADSQLRWGAMFFKESGAMGYANVDTGNMQNTWIYKIVAIY